MGPVGLIAVVLVMYCGRAIQMLLPQSELCFLGSDSAAVASHIIGVLWMDKLCTLSLE